MYKYILLLTLAPVYLFLSGCDESKLSQKEKHTVGLSIYDYSTAKTKKLITFKGILPNQHGAMAELKKLCLSHPLNYYDGANTTEKCSPIKYSGTSDGFRFSFYIDYGAFENVVATFHIFEDKISYIAVREGNDKQGNGKLRTMYESLEKFYEVELFEFGEYSKHLEDEQGNTLYLRGIPERTNPEGELLQIWYKQTTDRAIAAEKEKLKRDREILIKEAEKKL